MKSDKRILFAPGLINFYESELGQAIYSWRSKSIEPLIEHIKSVFRIDPLPVRGYYNAAGLVILLVTIGRRLPKPLLHF